MDSRLALFWSYAHSDDESDRGRIVTLANHVRSEFALVTGSEVDLFVDRDSISWGDDWRRRIDDALDSSSFLVPVLTPRYFQRTECRREFTDFHGQAESRGYGKLIMPILYSNIDGFEASSNDEIVALSARTQFFDWTPIRLADEASERYRTAVNEVVLRLSERWREMRQVEEKLSIASSKLAAPSELGFTEALQQVEMRLGKWRELVENDPVLVAQHQAIANTYATRLRRARPQQRLAIEHREVIDLLPISRRDVELAQAYSAATIEMNTHVLTLLRSAGQSPDLRPALRPLADAVLEAKQELDSPSGRLFPGEIWSHDYWPQKAHYGSNFRELAELITASEAFKSEGNLILANWITALRDLNLLETDEPSAP